MCGIFGVLWHKSDRDPEQERLEQTARLLRHRGPDGQGIFADRSVGLVHTRLSLLDLSERSNQPFWDKQNRFALVYNGEIYNFQQLRAELLKEGVEFRTTSDTEVLLEALLKWARKSRFRNSRECSPSSASLTRHQGVMPLMENPGENRISKAAAKQ
jgi:asparagine synthase (glutamine-hydrolysing)